MARMMCYLWENLDAEKAQGEPEIKFGDHWIPEDCTFDEAVENTTKYARGSLHRQKHLWDEGRVILHRVWDASDYARSVGRFKPHGKVDDEMRHCIGQHRKNDVHTIDANTAIIRVNRHFAKFNQPLPEAGLSDPQAQTAEDVLTCIENGSTTIVAELCARFGKTIWSGAVFVESDFDVMIIVSYVLTSFASFEKDLTSFSQFADIVHVDTQDPEYQSIIDNARRDGKRVLAYLSMCPSQKRAARIKYLFGLADKRLVVIDEADFGAHKSGQVKPLKAARQQDDVVILMTGTNGDRAASEWPVDKVITVTYPELIMAKRLTIDTV